MKNIVGHSFAIVERLYERKEMVTGLPTGFVDLDERTSGFQPSDLIIIAGRPSMGKTAFVLNIAAHAGARKRTSKWPFSALKCPRSSWCSVSSVPKSRVDAHKLRTGHLSERDWTPALECRRQARRSADLHR